MVRASGISRVLLAAVTAAALALAGGQAVAGDHNQKSCEAAGGTWTNDQGTKTCETSETETGRNEKFECTTESETSGQGNLGNKTEKVSGGEEGTPTGSGKCPHGQFKD